ncbi:hypothetical protein SBA6_980001 [Candidatus Sulfopaludibacter sp. SbA6]|nr:hypothetical protein SBA6_980001 [Candidatus Sulfopaludibacter sp. SbA6]
MLNCIAMRSNRFRTQSQLLQAERNAPPLGKGAQGAGVAQIQVFLRDLEYSLEKTFSRGKADGIFGSETDAAVRAFQRDYGLKTDGLVGKMTIGRMDQILVEKPYLDCAPPDSPRRKSALPSGRYVTSRLVKG